MKNTLMFSYTSSVQFLSLKFLAGFFCIFLFSIEGSSQVSLLNIQQQRITYKAAIKKAKKERVPVLAVCYSPTFPITELNQFQRLEEIISSHNVFPIVIDWVMAPDQYPQKYFKEIANPSWMYIHPDEIILQVNNNIHTDEALIAFLATGKELFQITEEVIVKNSKTKNPEGFLEKARISTKIYDKRYGSEMLEEYLKRINTKKIDDPAFTEIIKIGSRSPYSKRLMKIIENSEDRAIMLSSQDTILGIKQRYILNDLDDKGLLEPYYVWERFERELGPFADSLYRHFAIEFLAQPPVDAEQLYAEVFDYISFYPRSSWAYLDPLYNMVVSVTTNKEDLEVLMDLISFQIFREESFRQLDYKAVILYKLGQKERALSMMSQINESALSKGFLYKSLLYSLAEEDK